MPEGRIHFNKGKTNRFKIEMKKEDLEKVNELLGKDILEIGYEI